MTEPATRSRANAPSRLDFNDRPKRAHIYAAAATTTKQLKSLFEALHRADELFSRDQRAGFLAGLRAVSGFLAGNPHGKSGRFSRPFELAIAELNSRRDKVPGRIFSRTGSGPGGVDGRASDQHAKAAAAFACELLHQKCGIKVLPAAGAVAEALTAWGFKFGARRKNKSAAVFAWRRDYPRGTDPAAIAYRDYLKSMPIAFFGNPRADAHAIMNWLGNELARAGYGSVA